MSAVIHAFPTTTRPETDDLVDELARHLGDEHATIGTPDGPRRLVAIRPDRRGGSNDLVVTGTTTVRARRMLVVAAVVLVTVVLGLFAGFEGATAGSQPVVADTVVVQSGDTVWGLARQITPTDGDVRDNVTAIRRLNDVDSAMLQVGTVVRLPAVD